MYVDEWIQYKSLKYRNKHQYIRVLWQYVIPFFSYILEPTRLTKNSKILIDNIFLNSFEFETFSGNLISLISDHHDVKRVRIRSYSGLHFSRIFLLSWFSHSIFSLNAGKCGENADQNNSEYGYLLRSVHFTSPTGNIYKKCFWFGELGS